MNYKQIISNGKKLLNQESPITLYSNFGKVYGMTTENIKGTFENFDLNDKDILTVCSSGDHIFSAVTLGANKVNVFDVNFLTEYYFYFKKALIESVSFDEFKEILIYNLLPTGTLKLKDYEKVREYIDKPYLDFWDEIVDYVLSNDLSFKKLFFSTLSKHYEELTSYYTLENYNLLKERLSDIHVNFIHSDLTKLPDMLKCKYDYMFLSNISDYLGILETKKIAERLLKFIKENGEIAFAYMYDSSLKRASIYGSNILEVSPTSHLAEQNDLVLTLKKK